MHAPSLDGPSLNWSTSAVFTVGGAATVLLIAVAVLAITGVIRPPWSRPDAPVPDQSAPVSYRPPPPMVVDLRLPPAPTVGDLPMTNVAAVLFLLVRPLVLPYRAR